MKNVGIGLTHMVPGQYRAAHNNNLSNIYSTVTRRKKQHYDLAPRGRKEGKELMRIYS